MGASRKLAILGTGALALSLLPTGARAQATTRPADGTAPCVERSEAEQRSPSKPVDARDKRNALLFFGVLGALAFYAEWNKDKWENID
jgi:hypothetical protein